MNKIFFIGLGLSSLLLGWVLPAQADLFKHIKTFCMGVGMNTTDGKTWMQSHMDMDAAGAKLSAVSTKYVSWSDSQTGRLPISLQYLPLGKNFNNAFIHYAKDVTIAKRLGDPLNIASQRDVCMKEDRFPMVLVTNGIARTSGADAHFGQALKFTGAQTVSILKDTTPALGNSFTVEAWVKANSQTSTGIAGWGTSNGLWIDAWGHLAAEVNVNDTRQSCSQRYTFPAWDTWYHIVGVGDAAGGQTLLYVNGVAIGSVHSFAPGVITKRTGFFTVGNPTGSNYQGKIDDVRLYNRVLSASEINQRYVSNSSITDGLILRWDFDESAGTAITDASGNGNDGSYNLTNQAGTAFGDVTASEIPINFDLAFGERVDDALYLGLPWKFAEINFNLGRAADASWMGVWEYWNGSAWTALTITDGTIMLQQNGKVSFVPPSDWTHTIVTSYDLYWIRLNCTQAGATNPIARSAVQFSRTYEWRGVPGISHQKYQSSSDGNAWIVPGWDSVNDANSDGYISDGEFSALGNTLASARFKYRAIAPAWYFSDRWAMNFKDPDYLAYIANSSRAAMLSTGCDGIYIDNVQEVIPDISWGKAAYLEYSDPAAYCADVILALRRIRQTLNGGTLLINGGWNIPEIIDEVDGALHESAFYYRNSPSDIQSNIDFFNSQVAVFTAKNKKYMLGGNPYAGLTNSPGLARTRIDCYCLARYYLSASPVTYLMYSDMGDYAHPATDWFEALAYDIGLPVSDYFVYASERVGYPSPAPANLVSNASFEANLDADASLPDGWKKYNSTGTVTVAISSVGHSGSSSLLLTSVGNNTGGVYQNIALKAGTTYTVSGWIKTDQLQSAKASSRTAAQIIIYAGSGGYTGTNTARVGSGTRAWVFVSFVFTTGNNTAGAYVYGGQINDASGTAYFDEIRVEEGKYPTLTVFGRDYEKALVLLKAINAEAIAVDDYGDATGSPLALNDSYRLLAANGTLGPTTKTVSLRNFEGAILIKEASLTPIPSPPDGAQALVYPNPANNIVKFLAPLAWPAIDTTIDIFNISGRRVSKLTFINEPKKPLLWDTRELAPGVYIYVIYQNGKKMQTGKIVLKK